MSAIADTPALALAKKDWLSRIDAAESQAALPDTVRQALAELRESSQIWMRGSHDWSEERKMMDCLEALAREVRHLLEEGKAAEVGVLAEAMPEAAPNYILEARRTWMSITSRIEARREIEPDLNHLQRLASEGRLDEARTALETIPDASPEVRQIKKELLAQIEEAEQLREAIAAAVENGRNLAQEGRLAEARHEIEKLPDAPGHVLELKTALILQIDKIEQEHKSIQQALEESRRLAEEAQFDQARQVIETIHSTFVEVEQLKKELMVQIDEAEQFHKEIESTIEESQRLIKYGRIAEARQVIDRLPDTDALLEMKTNFLNQMDEMQQEYEKREADVSGMLDGLESIGVGRAGIEALARHNDVDLTNLWEFHAFLQAVTEQLPPSFRARMKSGAGKPAKRKWLRFWRQ